MNKQNTKLFLRKLLFSFYLRILPLSPEPSMGFQTTICKFHKNSFSERLLEGKAVTLWDVLTQHKAVSQKSFFSVFILRYFFFHNSPLWTSKYHFANSTRTLFRRVSWGESWNSVRWINRTQSSFSESFFPLLNGRYFLFHHSPLWASKYPFANSTRTALAKGFLKGNMKLCEMN